jgi:hypothetical protein
MVVGSAIAETKLQHDTGHILDHCRRTVQAGALRFQPADGTV